MMTALAVSSFTSCSHLDSNEIQRKLPAKKTISKKVETKQKVRQIKPYPLQICVVSDEPLDEWDDMQTMIHKGQQMKFCCKMCLKKFKKDPTKYLKILSGEVSKQKK